MFLAVPIQSLVLVIPVSEVLILEGPTTHLEPQELWVSLTHRKLPVVVVFFFSSAQK